MLIKLLKWAAAAILALLGFSILLLLLGALSGHPSAFFLKFFGVMEWLGASEGWGLISSMLIFLVVGILLIAVSFRIVKKTVT